MTARHERELRTRNLRREAFCQPTIPAGSVLIWNEPGRVLDLKSHGGNCDVTFESHCFSVTQESKWGFTLRVHHGGGEESWKLREEAVQAMAHIGSDQRYFLLYALMEAHQDSARAAKAFTAHQYQQAFVEGRLKKRKVRGQPLVNVHIEPKEASR